MYFTVGIPQNYIYAYKTTTSCCFKHLNMNWQNRLKLKLAADESICQYEGSNTLETARKIDLAILFEPSFNLVLVGPLI